MISIDPNIIVASHALSRLSFYVDKAHARFLWILLKDLKMYRKERGDDYETWRQKVS